MYEIVNRLRIRNVVDSGVDNSIRDHFLEEISEQETVVFLLWHQIQH